MVERRSQTPFPSAFNLAPQEAPILVMPIRVADHRIKYPANTVLFFLATLRSLKIRSKELQMFSNE